MPDNNWCEECDQFLWNCDCDEYEELYDKEFEDVEYLDEPHNIYEEFDDGEKFDW